MKTTTCAWHRECVPRTPQEEWVEKETRVTQCRTHTNTFVGFWKSGEKLERIKPAGCVKPFGTSVNEQNERTEAKDELESDDETRESWSFSTSHRVPRAHSQVLEYPTTGVIS